MLVQYLQHAQSQRVQGYLAVVIYLLTERLQLPIQAFHLLLMAQVRQYLLLRSMHRVRLHLQPMWRLQAQERLRLVTMVHLVITQIRQLQARQRLTHLHLTRLMQVVV